MCALDPEEKPLEKLDSLLKVAGSKSWISLSFFLLVIALVIMWSIFGTIPMTIEGKCILFNPETSYRVLSDETGFIQKINAKPGESVQAGELLAVVSPYNLMKKIGRVEQEIKEIEKLSSFEQQGLKEKKRELRRLQEDPENRPIFSPYTGKIAWVDVIEGSEVNPPTPLFWIHSPITPQEMKVLAFVPLYLGQEIHEGMKVLVSPDTIDSSRFGMLEAVVEQVSPYPISSSDYVMQKIPSESMRQY